MDFTRRRGLAAATLALTLPVACLAADGATKKKRPVGTLDDAAPDLVTYGNRDDVMRFADEVAARNPSLDGAWVREQLSQAKFVAAPTRLIMPPPVGVAKNWAAYRARFVERERIAADAVHYGFDDSEGDGSGQCRIDGVATARKSRSAGLRGQWLRCGDDIAGQHGLPAGRVGEIPVHGVVLGRGVENSVARDISASLWHGVESDAGQQRRSCRLVARFIPPTQSHRSIK